MSEAAPDQSFEWGTPMRRPATEGSSPSVGGVVVSASPSMAPNAYRESSAVRVRRPTVSSVVLSGTTPVVDHLPVV